MGCPCTDSSVLCPSGTIGDEGNTPLPTPGVGGQACRLLVRFLPPPPPPRSRVSPPLNSSTDPAGLDLEVRRDGGPKAAQVWEGIRGSPARAPGGLPGFCHGRRLSAREGPHRNYSPQALPSCMPAPPHSPASV